MQKSLSLLLISLTLQVALSITDPPLLTGTVYFDGATNKYRFEQGVIDQSGVAFGSFSDGEQVNGWGVLRIETNSKFPDDNQMFAAGYLEGALTHERIHQNYLNMYNVFFAKEAPSSLLLQFLSTQDTWTRSNIKSNPTVPHWQGVSFIMSQFDGLKEGYNALSDAGKKLDTFAFQLLNGVGDFLDLLSALHPERRIDWKGLDKETFLRTVSEQGHCSALIKISPDYSDLYSSHSSWFTYGAMNRIYKHYLFNLNSKFIVSKKMSFSSYPGFIESLDDFYIMDSGLVMLQTTNSIFNNSLWDYVSPKSLLAWQRVRLANSMSKNGKEWSYIISMYNSGTYNNQYMIINYNLFIPYHPLPSGSLYVAEQIPGLVMYDDVTHQLERGYWPSYNIPYFDKIYELSGYPEMVNKYGTDVSYQLAPRAKIFRRDQSKVIDLDSFKDLMRYNDYLNDPFSDGNPGNAICSRFDLSKKNPSPSGCYDTKVTNYELQKNGISHAINGPTTSHNLPPFKWVQEFNNTKHFGQPDTFNFDFIVMDPKW